MAYRPTIAIYMDGRAIDIGLYRNWDDERLFYQALALALLLSRKKTFNEAKRAAHAMRADGGKALLTLSEEANAEDIRFITECSENTVLIDLSARAVYNSPVPLEKSELKKRPLLTDLLSDMAEKDEFRRSCAFAVFPAAGRIDFYKLLTRCVIDIDALDAEAILSVFREFPELASCFTPGMRQMLHSA